MPAMWTTVAYAAVTTGVFHNRLGSLFVACIPCRSIAVVLRIQAACRWTPRCDFLGDFELYVYTALGLKDPVLDITTFAKLK
jgi:hypothetical protein